jgi:adenylyltransferase and sulfurtransferase
MVQYSSLVLVDLVKKKQNLNFPGSPAALYLAAAGVGRIGLVDFDLVDKSNLHRQVIHPENREGIPKVLSAKLSCLSLNSSIQVETYQTPFNEKNGMELVKKYDVVIDASDNVTTRYLVNDACILSGKPLVSASAVRVEGQMTVYGHNGGPCYRCLFPEPPPPETVTNCSDGGVLGVVPGVMGCLQALEAQKILMGKSDVLSSRMLLFNGSTCTFKNAKLRSKVSRCKLCGDNPTIKELIPYTISCETKKNELSENNRISVEDYKKLMDSKEPHLLIDVRVPVQYDICSLPGAQNFPLQNLNQDQIKEIESKNLPIYVVCRRGIASLSATELFLKYGVENVKNIDGGITRWTNVVDKNFPIY